MIAELNQAPEAKKADLEAAILTKLVAQHHRMLGEWASMHEHRLALWRERTQASGSGTMHATVGQNPAGPQK